MKIKENLKLRQVGSSFFIVDTNKEMVDFTDIFVLNKEAAFLWQEFQGKDFTVEAMVERLCSRYDVNHDTAQQDVEEMLNTWQVFGLLQ